MANQIQATVYQIDGSPLTNSIQIAFLTSNVYMREFQTDLIPAVNSAIVYYPNTNNQLQEQTFLVSETITALVSSANSGGTTQISTTVLEINQEPQIPSGVTFSFPVQGISIWPVANPIVGGVNSYLEFKNKKYYLLEDEGALVTAANAGGGGSSTGVNGLNGTTNIGLGGTLTNNTLIDTDGFIFEIQNGLNLDSNQKLFILGDYVNANNQFKLIIDDANQLISTTDSNGANGLAIGTGFANIGAFTGSYLYLGINQGNGTMQAFNTASTSNGLSLDFNVGSYLFGSYNSVGNYIQIDDTLNSIITSTSNLEFNGASLEDPTPGVIATKALLITLNGTQYKINLY